MTTGCFNPPPNALLTFRALTQHSIDTVSDWPTIPAEIIARRGDGRDGPGLDGNLGVMDRSGIIPAQVRYWDRVAGEKQFSHPLRIAWLTRYAGLRARILDFGCGHGRTLAELLRGGYNNIIGIDFSFRMLKCCRSQLPNVSLVQNDGKTIPLHKHSVDLVLLFAVLTCIPLDEEQRHLVREIRRVLRPGGLLYISDLLLNRDSRNLERYDSYAGEYGTYGIFELPEGVVVRHHRKEWIEEVTCSFGQVEFEPFEVRTMNGNKSAGFQYLCRALPSPNDSVDS